MSVREARRRRAARALVALAGLCMIVALTAGYVRRAAVDPEQFANRASAAVRDDAVRALIADRVTDELVLEREPDLIAARPLVRAVVEDVVGGRAFVRLFRFAVRDVHRALFSREQDTVLLTLADVGTVVAAALEKLRPSLARDVRASAQVTLLRRDVGAATAKAARAADRVRLLALLALGLCVAAAAAALALSADRRGTVVALGVTVVVAAVALLVAYRAGRSLAVAGLEEPEARAAAGAVWDAFLGDLRGAAWILGGCGAVVAAAAASVVRPVALGAPLRLALDRVVREPARPALRALRGIGLAGLGLALLVAQDAVVHLALTALGLYLVYEGASALLRLVHRPTPPAAARAVRGPRRRLAAALVAGTLIAAAVVTFASTGGTSTAAPALGACNGDAALCDRSLDRVALVATHNSMSAPLPGWYSSAQDRPIADQLVDGVRGLLIDTHEADRLPSGRVRTFFGSRAELRSRSARDGVGDAAVDAALRLRERLGFEGEGTRGRYVCHSFCELGATPLADVLGDLRSFLVANPDEVVVVVNQDYVAPADLVADVEAAGLGGLVYRGPVDGRWPTLREMIDRDERLVVLAENHAGGAPWYRSAYGAAITETPYAFSRPDQLTDRRRLAASCRPNRGRDGAPLFLLNHWVTTDPVPRPSDAAKVNAYAPLLERARECGRRRGQAPNLVAVNFYRQGDVRRVVNTLNGVG